MKGIREGGALPPALLGLGLVAISLATRGLIPIDETRYAAVAWEMSTGGDWLVPHLNGAPYSHKPPLLFWLVCLGWKVLGVSEAWPRIVPALFSLASLFVTTRIARRLWPQDAGTAALAPWILAGTGLWALFGTVLFFDPLVAFFTLVAALGVLRAAEGKVGSGWILFGCALGLGILAKGPVVFVFTLPLAFLGPWWGLPRVRSRPAVWYAGLLAAVLLCVAIALAWAIPASRAGGAAYRDEIFWGQTADRLVQSFAHRRPSWFYAAALPLVLFPWSLWWPVVGSVARLLRRPQDPGTRFCLASIVPGLILLSTVSGKQPQYLLPILPGFALLASRAVSQASETSGRRARAFQVFTYLAVGLMLLLVSSGLGSSFLPEGSQAIPPWAGFAMLAGSGALLLAPSKDAYREARLLAVAMLAFLAILHVGAAGPALLSQDIREVAQRIRQAQTEERPVAHVGHYHGQYQFLGRLSRPLEEIEAESVADWAREHPTGKIVLYEARGWTPRQGRAPELVRPYRGRTVVVWSAGALPEGIGDDRR